MLRAAYFGQELLSTFGPQIGEIALVPSVGGLFQVHLTYVKTASASGAAATEGEGEEQEGQVVKVLLWDRKSEGGFPETKVLKQKVRDHIDPNRDLGHSDKAGKNKEAVKEGVGMDEMKKGEGSVEQEKGDVERKDGSDGVKRNPDGTVCEDCQ
ncbi:hypothetical protein J1614_007664 [Plenodomus biglobosus]|nr:hypothetical protein J1614_007664 [Plenodomus biglobosus]